MSLELKNRYPGPLGILPYPGRVRARRVTLSGPLLADDRYMGMTSRSISTALEEAAAH
jgi:hypothetical protein